MTRRTEQIIHKAVASHLRARPAENLVWWHTANGARFGGKNPAMHGAIMKSLGVRAGVSDLILLREGNFYALELKAPGGRPTESQLEFLSDVQRAGGYSVCAEGLDEAICCLEHWGLLKGKAA